MSSKNEVILQKISHILDEESLPGAKGRKGNPWPACSSWFPHWGKGPLFSK